jgi:hypothetical protein
VEVFLPGGFIIPPPPPPTTDNFYNFLTENTINIPYSIVTSSLYRIILCNCNFNADKTTYMLVCTVYILVGLAFTSTIIELVRYILYSFPPFYRAGQFAN